MNNGLLMGVGRFDIGAGAPPAGMTLTHLGNSAITETANPFSVVGASFGPADASRIIVVAFVAFSTGTSLASVTIGGVAATQRIGTVGSATRLVGIYTAVVPSGTTGDIIVTLSGVPTRYGMSWWSINGSAQSAPHDVTAILSTTANTINTSAAGFDVPAGGAAIAINWHNNTTAGGETTWTQDVGTGTERLDSQAGSGGQWVTTYETTQAATGITITATNAQAATLIQLAAMSWAP